MENHLFFAIYKKRLFLLFGVCLPGEISYKSNSGLTLHTDAGLVSIRKGAFFLHNWSVYIREIVLQNYSTLN